MRILYYDCFAGISGDMNLSALLDLGVPFDYLTAELSKLKIDSFKLECVSSVKMGISGIRTNVIIGDNHHADHDHGVPRQHHECRNLHDIQKIITESTLSEHVKNKSMEMFRCIGEVESEIHSKPVDDIHFHEVGAIDSIIDIVGAAICVEYLKPDRIISSTVELGGGVVYCEHGTYPVPVPATTKMVQGFPVSKGTVDREATTPTGAAILRAFVDEFTDRINFRIQKTGIGIGSHDFPIPNVLRIFEAEWMDAGIRKEMSHDRSGYK